jgi:thioredoxin-related protein
MRKIAICALLMWMGCLGVVAQNLPDADRVLADVEKQASAQQKNVLVVFGASWCKYCHLFEKFLGSPEIQPIVDKHFVIARLGVYEEMGRHPELNNPKSDRLVRKFGDHEAGGLPFLVMVDTKGDLIVNSNLPEHGGNIGYPAAPEEIDWFMVMMKKAAPTISEADATTVEQWLRKASPHR